MFTMRRIANVTGLTHVEMTSIGKISHARYHLGPARCVMYAKPLA